MKKTFLLSSILFCLLLCLPSKAQINEDQLGAWYMYFFDTKFNEGPWGIQGDIQYRNWNLGGDLEQLLLRGGLTYSPKSTKLKLTFGYGNITTGSFGSEKTNTTESRIYQEVLFPFKLANRIFTTHRYRYEQRFVENQDFRTRYRYNLFVNVPINKANMESNTIYIALYNELFINGQRAIGNGNEVEIFDRNRFYSALGYQLKPGMKFQLGLMNQATNNWTKNQMQLSFHHNW